MEGAESSGSDPAGLHLRAFYGSLGTRGGDQTIAAVHRLPARVFTVAMAGGEPIRAGSHHVAEGQLCVPALFLAYTGLLVKTTADHCAYPFPSRRHEAHDRMAAMLEEARTAPRTGT